MNHFFAIMKESLWSTMASRLLYFEIGGVILLLLALLPFTYSEEVVFEVSPRDINRPQAFAEQWLSAGQRDDASAAHLFWKQLAAEQQETVRQIAQNELPARRGRGSSARNQLSEILNEVVVSSEVWNDPFWIGNIDGRETKQLWESRGSLTSVYHQRLNRLLLQEAFRGQIRSPSETNAILMYGTFKTVNLGMSRIGLEALIRSWAPFVLDKFVLTIGLLLAILVTASLIPQMLEEGSLYLLISKPVSRVFLLLTKYIGSGVLVLVVTTILLVGVWLVLGIRFQIWINELLWCIPLYVAVFLVYYSVTVTVGLLFRNPIIAIIVTILFAGLCYSLSISRYVSGGLVAFDRTANMTVLGDDLFRINTYSQTKYLQGDNQWGLAFFERDKDMPEEVFRVMAQVMPFPGHARAIHLPDLNVVVGAVPTLPPEKRLIRLGVARSGNQAELTTPKILGELPPSCIGFVQQSDGRLLAISSFGTVFQLNETGGEILTRAAAGIFPSEIEIKEADRQTEAVAGAGPAESSDDLPNPSAGSDLTDSDENQGPPESATPVLGWEAVGVIASDGPESMERVAFDRQSNQFFVIGRSLISRASQRSDGTFATDLVFSFPWAWSFTNRTPLALVGGRLLVPSRGGALVIFSTTDLQPVAEYDLSSEGVPLSAAADPAGRFAVINYSGGKTWVFDRQSDTLESRRFVSDTVTVVAVAGVDRVLVAHGVDSITEFDLNTMQEKSRIRPTLGLIRWGFEWIVEPVYAIFPKPNECYVIVESFANAGGIDDSREMEKNPSEPDVDVETFNLKVDSPWSPLISSLAFAAVVMLFNCIYFARQEF